MGSVEIDENVDVLTSVHSKKNGGFAKRIRMEDNILKASQLSNGGSEGKDIWPVTVFWGLEIMLKASLNINYGDFFCCPHV